jgi:hypothetical protein
MAQPDPKRETPTDKDQTNPDRPNPVRDGGIAREDAAAEDVSRDTYGFTGSKNIDTEVSPDEARRRVDEILPDKR